VSLVIGLADDVSGGGAENGFPCGRGLLEVHSELPVARLLYGVDVAEHPLQIGRGGGVHGAVEGEEHVVHGHLRAVGERDVVADIVDVGLVVRHGPVLGKQGDKLVFLVEREQALGYLVDDGVGGKIIGERGVQLYDVAVESDGEGDVAAAGRRACRAAAAAAREQRQRHRARAQKAQDSFHFFSSSSYLHSFSFFFIMKARGPVI